MASRKPLLQCLAALTLLLLILYLTPLVVFRCSRSFQRYLLFMNHLDAKNSALAHPERVGLNCSRVLPLEFVDDDDDDDDKEHGPAASNARLHIKLGVWHILPTGCNTTTTSATTGSSSSSSGPVGENFTHDNRPIVLYLHGNNGNRATDYRVHLYKQLVSRLRFHLVTFDYRGYGDSTDATPSTFGLASDALNVYKWLLSQPGVTRARLTVWGHSLGTAVAVRMVAKLAPELEPRQLVLEAPFDSVEHVLREHTWTLPYRRLPYFEQLIVEPVVNAPELNFNSLELLDDIKWSRILILHAEDDSVIVHKLGVNLYEEALREHGKERVTFFSLPANYSLGHNHINTHNETMLRVGQFIEFV